MSELQREYMKETGNCDPYFDLDSPESACGYDEKYVDWLELRASSPPLPPFEEMEERMWQTELAQKAPLLERGMVTRWAGRCMYDAFAHLSEPKGGEG
jgi:hypothetical protein